jgi:hypothetical protein
MFWGVKETRARQVWRGQAERMIGPGVLIQNGAADLLYHFNYYRFIA